MMCNKIVIFSLEGIESNTEKNFFRGMKMHFSLELEIYSIGKQSGKENSSKRIKGIIDRILPEIESKKEILFFFFIGDCDVKEDMKSMQRAKNTIIKELEDFFNKKFQMKKEIICEPAKSFDDVLNDNKYINESKIIDWKTKKHKKQSNKLLFENILKVLCKNENIDIDEEKELIMNVFKNTNYEILFKKIFNK